MISKDDILLFVHIFKNAGTTFRRGLLCSYDAKKEHGPFDAGAKSPKSFRNMNQKTGRRIRLITGHMAYGFHKTAYHVFGRPCIYISLVRHPVERVVSLRSYLRMGKCSNHPLHSVFQQYSLEECFDPELQNKIGNRKWHFLQHQTVNHQVRILSSDICPPVYRWGQDITKKELDISIRHIEDSFSFIQTVKRLDLSWGKLSKKLGLKRPPLSHSQPSKRANTTPKQLKKIGVTSSCLKAIEENNQYDLALYRYVEKNADRINQKPIVRLKNDD